MPTVSAAPAVPAIFLLDLTNAITYTGRPAGTIHRWVAEGRITRHGTPRRGLYDFRELPAKGSGAAAPPRRNDQVA